MPRVPLLLVMLILALPVLLHSSQVRASAEAGEEDPGQQYLSLEPAIVTNFGAPSRPGYLKADIVLRVRGDSDSRAQVRHHFPLLRHHLLMLLHRQTAGELDSSEGREELRQLALATVQQLLEEETGATLVDDLLFSSFIVQGGAR